MRNPKPFTVFQTIPGQNPKQLFTVYAYSLAQARALVAAKVAGETVVVDPKANVLVRNISSNERVSRWSPRPRTAFPRWLCLSDAKIDQTRHGA